MLKDYTIKLIIFAVKPFKVKLEYLSCEIKDKQANFKFKICNKINAAKMSAYVDDIRMRLICREKVQIEILTEDVFVIILPAEFAEEKTISSLFRLMN